MAVLESIFAENFTSFADRIEFTCKSVSNQKNNKNNTFIYGETELNRVSYIYGANGSGKSNFCRIIDKIQNTIVSSSFAGTTNQSNSQYRQQFPTKLHLKGFAFDKVYHDKPTTLGIDLLIDEVKYHYEFSVFNNEIVREILQKKRKRTETILERTSPDYKDITVKSELKNFEPLKQTVRNNALCLAIAANLNHPLADSIINSIFKIKVFNLAFPHLGPADIELFSDEKMAKYLKIIQHADPTIVSMNATFLEEPSKSNTSTDDFENRNSIEKRIKVRINTEHHLYNNEENYSETTTDVSFFGEESIGTVKLFTTLPYLFDALDNGDVLILDEIENGLHLNLAKEIINLFINKNPNHAQLICTSHQPLLLDGTNPNRDQVWIFHKDEYGKCTLDRLSNDSNSRSQSNLSKRIIDGALGCNPKLFFTE